MRRRLRRAAARLTFAIPEAPGALLLVALCTSAAVPARAADVRAYMTVTANVVDTVAVKPLHQAQAIVITAQDIARGYLDIRGGSRIEVRSVRPTLLEFQALSGPVTAVRVTGADKSARFTAPGGTLLHKAPSTGISAISLDYRFELSPAAQPGRHAWPVTLTLLPL